MMDKPMTENEILDKAKEDLGEWLEMSNNPDADLAKYLATKIQILQCRLIYTDKMLNQFRQAEYDKISKLYT